MFVHAIFFFFFKCNKTTSQTPWVKTNVTLFIYHFVYLAFSDWSKIRYILHENVLPLHTAQREREWERCGRVWQKISNYWFNLFSCITQAEPAEMIIMCNTHNPLPKFRPWYNINLAPVSWYNNAKHIIVMLCHNDIPPPFNIW